VLFLQVGNFLETEAGMSVIIESSYGKTIGLPGYSSHKFCLSVKTEVSDLSKVEAEAARVYQILQTAVDTQLVKPGLVPNGHASNGEKTNGNEPTTASAPTNTGTTGGHGASEPTVVPWNCSEKQRALIEDIVQRNKLEFAVVADLAKKRFGKEIGALNRLEASGLIDELLETYGKHQPATGRRHYQRQLADAGRGRST
jgi:hypothetical protein